MRIVVENKETKNRALLIGTGFGAYATSRASPISGNLSHSTSEGTYKLICITDSTGDFIWVNSQNYQIVSIDGVTPREISDVI